MLHHHLYEVILIISARYIINAIIFRRVQTTRIKNNALIFPCFMKSKSLSERGLLLISDRNLLLSAFDF
jgi:hypothetical protein